MNFPDDDDLTRSKHVGVILSVFKVFYVEVMLCK